MKKTLLLLASLLLLACLWLPQAEAATARAGDADGDGTCTAADARIALRLSVQLDRATAEVRQYSDADGDGSITASDARTVLRVSTGLDDSAVLASFTPTTASSSTDSYHRLSLRLQTGETRHIPELLYRAGTPFSWTSSNPAAATVDAAGKITALQKGFSCIILQSGNEKFYVETRVLTPEQLRLDALREKYPEGYYWNNHTPSAKYPAVSDIPCDDHLAEQWAYCKGQCWGFASLISDEVFGEDAPVTYGVTLDTMRIGDQLRTSHHSVIVTDILLPGDVIGYNYYTGQNSITASKRVIVVHCNWNYTCNILWDFDYSYYLLYGGDTLYPEQSYTRY